MPLNDRQIKNAKPAAKPYKLADGHSFYLLVNPSGGKYWRLDYAIDGKRKTLAIGTYPTISLVEAREAAENARRMVANGQSPSEAKQRAKADKAAALKNTFQAIAADWHAHQFPRWKENHAARVWLSLEQNALPRLGKLPIGNITAKDIKAVIDEITARGAAVTADKVRQRIESIFNYAVSLDLANANPASPLRGYIIRQDVKHMPALPCDGVPEFYRRLLASNTSPQNRIAILLTMLVFVRSTEIRGGQWAEIDWQAKIWTIPAERMKKPRPHIVPLSDWALELLRELHNLSGQGRFMFPSLVNSIIKLSHSCGLKLSHSHDRFLIR